MNSVKSSCQPGQTLLRIRNQLQKENFEYRLISAWTKVSSVNTKF